MGGRRCLTRIEKLRQGEDFGEVVIPLVSTVDPEISSFGIIP